MRLISCGKGHFYDGEKYDICPYCNEVGEPLSRSTVPVTSGIPVVNAPADDDEEVTVAYDKDADREQTLAYQWSTPENEPSQETAAPSSIPVPLPQKDRFEPVVGWLVCVDGAERGRDYRLLAGRNYIGRSLDMDVSIPDDPQLSRERHCSVIYDPRSFRFVLLPGESTLTMVNGEAQNMPFDIKDGDIISCGSTKLCFISFCKEGRDWE